jgi:uncharacterized membrane protein YGL010W
MAATKKLKKYFEDYAKFHKKKGNKVTHYIGIPLIVISLFGLLGNIVIMSFDLSNSYLQLDCGVILLILGSIWYLLLDWKITIPFIFVLCGMYFLGRALPMPVNWVLFALGWVLQGVGHAVYEKKSPAFVKNLTHLLIGPLWIFARIFNYR